MGIKIIFLLLLALATDICTAANTGFIQFNMMDGSHLYSPIKIGSNTKIHLQFPDAKGNAKCCFRIKGRNFSPASPSNMVLDVLDDQLIYHYKLRNPLHAIKSPPFIGIAVIGYAQVQQTNETELVITTANNKILTSLCTSEEGVHVLSKVKETILSDLYLELGYSIDRPTCPN